VADRASVAVIDRERSPSKEMGLRRFRLLKPVTSGAWGEVLATEKK
jgi:hypothetical protein